MVERDVVKAGIFMDSRCFSGEANSPTSHWIDPYVNSHLVRLTRKEPSGGFLRRLMTWRGRWKVSDRVPIWGTRDLILALYIPSLSPFLAEMSHIFSPVLPTIYIRARKRSDILITLLYTCRLLVRARAFVLAFIPECYSRELRN